MANASIPKQLARPLGASVALSKSASLAEATGLLRSPPKTQLAKPPLPSSTPMAPPMVRELEEEFGATDSPTVAQAMMTQSIALNQLVSHIASNHLDPMLDLPHGAGSSSRGAQGRARLQMELASHKGVFFDAVMRSMARRMAPTLASADLSGEEMMAHGISGIRYLERFGGYGHRDLGLLQYQIMTAFDFMMTGNHGAARDTLALTSVMIEQATLDNGRFDVAVILGLMEDPLSSIFMNRQVLNTSRAMGQIRSG